MDLIIVRHGIAVEIGHPGVVRDADRVLSAEGRKKTRQAALGLRELGCAPGRVLTSPYPRARETAEIMARVLAPQAEVGDEAALAPGGAPGQVVRSLATPGPADVMVVGHMPGVAELAAYLLCGGSPAPALVFKKAAACKLCFDGRPAPGAAVLEWLLQPKALRCLQSGKDV